MPPNQHPAPAFLLGHATHPDWRAALALAAAQVDARRARALAAGAEAAASDVAASTAAAAVWPLGLLYVSDRHAGQLEAVLAELRQRYPGVAWAGSVGVGLAAGAAEYFDEPAVALMLLPLRPDQFELFSGARPLRPRPGAAFDADTALVHADPATADLPELLQELAGRTASGFLFGGLASSRGAAPHVADGVWHGGLSGVALAADVALLSRVTQGCAPIGPGRRVTRCEGHLVLTLDGEPALDMLLRDLGLADLDALRAALPRLRNTLVGLDDPAPPLADGSPGAAAARPDLRSFGAATRVRHLVGLDPAQRAVAVAQPLQLGERLTFCQRDVQAARRDLVRVCSEIRDSVESAVPAQRIAGVHFVSCAGRGGPHFGGPSAEIALVQHALGAAAAPDGEWPLLGFFAAGEIGHRHLYGYTAIVTVFTAPA